MCEVAAAAAALQLRAPPALAQLPVRQMRLAGMRWPWPTAASSDSQAAPALALVASSALLAATAVSSALVRPAASDWLEVQPSSSDRQPPECHLTQRAAVSRRHSQRGAAPAVVPVKPQLADAAASHAPATRGLQAARARGASSRTTRQQAAQLWAFAMEPAALSSTMRSVSAVAVGRGEVAPPHVPACNAAAEGACRKPHAWRAGTSKSRTGPKHSELKKVFMCRHSV